MMAAMSSASEILVVYVTAPPAEAPALARGLVERGLVACVNIIPAVRSLYTWNGEIQDDEESLLVIKTTRAAFAKLRDTVVELHSYDVAEVLALPAVDGNPPYVDWVHASVRTGTLT